MTNDLKDKPTIERLSSDKLMGLFARTPFIACVVLAIVLHVALFGVTSATFIWKTYFAKEQPAAAGAATNAAPDAVAATNLPSVATGAQAAVTANVTPAPAAPAPVTNAAAAPDPEDAELARHKETPTVKEISEAAKPDEIPRSPEDIGISIEDTNPF